jgi:hypothetical protein
MPPRETATPPKLWSASDETPAAELAFDHRLGWWNLLLLLPPCWLSAKASDAFRV